MVAKSCFVFITDAAESVGEVDRQKREVPRLSADLPKTSQGGVRVIVLNTPQSQIRTFTHS